MRPRAPNLCTMWTLRQSLLSLTLVGVLFFSACKEEPPPEKIEAEPEVVIEIDIGWYSFCEGTGSTGCLQIIPGGTFYMGAQSTSPNKPGYDPHAQTDEGPVHKVTLRSYAIQQDPVTARHYEQCIQKAGCTLVDVRHGPGTWNLGRKDRLTHPVNGVTWLGAKRFCSFQGGRLPTEAEWEFAARGTDQRRFPWGNEPRCGRYPQDAGPFVVNIVKPTEDECINDRTISVFDTQFRGQSPFLLNGMAGNVWEWVGDWYAEDAYQANVEANVESNPNGPSEGTARVQRGGGWANTNPLDLRSAARGSLPPDMQMDDVGFRCAWDLPQKGTP